MRFIQADNMFRVGPSRILVAHLAVGPVRKPPCSPCCVGRKLGSNANLIQAEILQLNRAPFLELLALFLGLSPAGCKQIECTAQQVSVSSVSSV